MKAYLDGILLPVPPEKITRKIKNQNKTKTLISGEQINILLPAGLTEITLNDVLLPNNAYSFSETDEGGQLRPASYYLDMLETLKRSQKAVSFVANESSDGTCADGDAETIKVTVEQYTINQDIEEGANVTVDITLKMYREYGLESYPVVTTSSSTSVIKTSSRTEKTTDETTYTVQSGDTLWSIAKKFYGDGSLYPYLASINGLSNPNLIHTGRTLKIGSTADAKAYTPTKSASSGSSSSGNSSSTSTSSSTKKLASLSALKAVTADSSDKSAATTTTKISSMASLSDAIKKANMDIALAAAKKASTAKTTQSASKRGGFGGSSVSTSASSNGAG